MPHQSSSESSAAAARSRTLLRAEAAAVVLFGLAVLISWHAHWTGLLQIAPNSPAIKYNTGVCFILCAVGLALLTTRFRSCASLFGAAAIVIGLASLLEYSTEMVFSLDELVVRDYIFYANDSPGRMAQLSAGSFTLLGIALVLASAGFRDTWRLPIIAALACVVAVIAGVALCGYAFGFEEAYGWGAYTRMAAHTACAFLVLSLALLQWAKRTARERGFHLGGWLPVVGSVTLMAMVAFVSSISMQHLKSSFDWRMHSYEVLLSVKALRGDIAGMQGGARGYMLTGEAASLEPYWSNERDARLQLATLRNLTADDAAQKPRLVQLTSDIGAISDHTKHLVDVRDSQGMKAAIDQEAGDSGHTGIDRALADLQSFSDAESQLLILRTARAHNSVFSTGQLLVLASILAGALLAWAHVRYRVEMTRRRGVEAALVKQSALQMAILNAANYAIISSSPDRIITTFNATAERWLGYTAAEVIGKVAPSAWYDAAEVSVRASALSGELGFPVSGSFEVLVAKARLGNREESEWTMIRKDGSRFPVFRSVTAQVDTAGNVIGYVSVITDLTIRKEQETEIRLSEERFRRAFENGPIGMALVDPEGRWLRVNHALCRMLAYSGAQLLERDVQSATHPDDRAATEGLMRDAIAGKDRSYQLEKRYVRSDGSLVAANLSVSLVRDAAGVPLYFISQIEDITERREGERIKRELAANVSHELRTPLTSIRGALGLIDSGVLGELPVKAQRMMQIAQQNSERMGHIIDDILDVEKIASGKLEVQCETVAVNAFLTEAAAIYQPYGTNYDVRFVFEALPTEAYVQADPHRLMQVMANLLSNAAKFSTPGAEVSIRAIDCGLRMRIEVQDRGTGIPEEFQSRIFEKFSQADPASSRRFAGTGLGLNITRDLVKAMHGTIGFDTCTDAGTTFHFELPRAEPVLSTAA